MVWPFSTGWDTLFVKFFFLHPILRPYLLNSTFDISYTFTMMWHAITQPYNLMLKWKNKAEVFWFSQKRGLNVHFHAQVSQNVV